MDQLPIVIKETNARCSDIGKLMDYLCVILDKFNSDAVENIIRRNVNIGNDSRFATGYTVFRFCFKSFSTLEKAIFQCRFGNSSFVAK